MLLQSHLKEQDHYVLQLLPALPEAWRTGEVKGLRARGGFIVDLTWKEGQLISGPVTSVLGNPVTLLYGTKKTSLTTTKGARLSLHQLLKK